METTKVIRNLLSDDETRAIANQFTNDDNMVTYEMRAAWSAMIFHSFNEMKTLYFPNIAFRFVDAQPYASADDMRDDIRKNKQILVSTQYNDINTLSPIFKSAIDNLSFRATHDLHHALTENCNFELDGEICAFSKFAKNCLSWGNLNRKQTMANHLIMVLASEIIGQVCVVRHTGEFPRQHYNLCVSHNIVDRILTAYNVW